MGTIGGLLALLLAVGCGDQQSKDMQIRRLQEENQALKGDNQGLQDRIAAAMRDYEAANRRALELQDLYNKAMNDLAMRSSTPTTTAPPGWTEFGDIAWTSVAENILFDSGKADLKSTARSKLTDIVGQIRSSYPDREVIVVGHTDTDPIQKSKWTDNLELSVQRGAAVTRELKKLGMDPARIIAAGAGEFQPRTTNANKTGKQANRRVQIITVRKPPETMAPGATEEIRTEQG
jgi:chemotaxis protein MotB